MMPVVLPLKASKLTEDEFYALGDPKVELFGPLLCAMFGAIGRCVQRRWSHSGKPERAQPKDPQSVT